MSRQVDHAALVLKELVDTERSFLSAIQTAIEAFYHPLLAAKVAPVAEINAVFGQLESLVPLSHTLLTDLSAAAAGAKDVASVFMEFVPMLRLFAFYIAGYSASLEAQGRLANNKKYRATIAQLQLAVGAPLSSLLIAPVQRLPRYELLLKDLIRYTSPGDSDYEPLQAALAAVTAGIRDVNDSLDEISRRQELLRVETETGATGLVAPHRLMVSQTSVKVIAFVGELEGLALPAPGRLYLLSDCLLMSVADRSVIMPLDAARVVCLPQIADGESRLKIYTMDMSILAAMDTDDERMRFASEVVRCIMIRIGLGMAGEETHQLARARRRAESLTEQPLPPGWEVIAISSTLDCYWNPSNGKMSRMHPSSFATGVSDLPMSPTTMQRTPSSASASSARFTKVLSSEDSDEEEHAAAAIPQLSEGSVEAVSKLASALSASGSDSVWVHHQTELPTVAKRRASSGRSLLSSLLSSEPKPAASSPTATAVTADPALAQARTDRMARIQRARSGPSAGTPEPDTTAQLGHALLQSALN